MTAGLNTELLAAVADEDVGDSSSATGIGTDHDGKESSIQDEGLGKDGVGQPPDCA